MSTRLVYWSYVVSLSVFVLCAVVAAGADEGRLQRYENKEHRVSFSYPNGWRAMSAEEVRRETQGRFDTQKGFVFLVDPRDYDRNVNVAAHRLPPPGVVTDADLATLEVQLDKQYRQIMPDYRKIASRRLDIAGARGLEVVYDTKQLDLPLRQKSLMIPKYGTNYVLTFTAPTSHYETAEARCFNVIMQTLKIGDADDSAPQAEAKPLTPGTLRFDGLYYAKSPDGSTWYLRFYEDGTVLDVDSTGTPEKVAQWFKKGHPAPSQGTYRRNGATMKFSTRSSAGVVDYAGEVGQDVLRLQMHSRINGFKATATYTFVKL